MTRPVGRSSTPNHQAFLRGPPGQSCTMAPRELRQALHRPWQASPRRSLPGGYYLALDLRHFGYRAASDESWRAGKPSLMCPGRQTIGEHSLTGSRTRSPRERDARRMKKRRRLAEELFELGLGLHLADNTLDERFGVQVVLVALIVDAVLLFRPLRVRVAD